jgi:branched-chain amino acid transport system ATP-binding protein
MAAQLMGVDVDRHSMIGFALGAMLAGLVGGLLVTITGINLGRGGPTSIKAFLMIMIGGAGVISGAIAGGFIPGMVESIGLTANNDISFAVAPQEILSVIGPNGAGKSSILRAITGLRKITSGSIGYLGQRLDGTPAVDIVRKGIALVPAGRRVFPLMSVKNNLLMGAFTRTDKAGIDQTLESVLTRFPRLKERFHQQASTLSGGEQQMMVIGRAPMAKPKLLLLDEPSLGIAPKLVQDIARAIVSISRDEGVSVLLVEQKSRMVLSISSRAYALSTGQVVLSGASKDLINDDQIKAADLGGIFDMRLLVINPDSTASMTRKIGVAAGAAASPGTEIIAVNPAKSPVPIEGYHDEAMIVPGLSGPDRARHRGRCHHHRLFRRYASGCRPLPDRPPRDRHRRGRLSLRLLSGEQVFSRHHACAVCAGAGTQPAPLWAGHALRPGAVIRGGGVGTGDGRA